MRPQHHEAFVGGCTPCEPPVAIFVPSDRILREVMTRLNLSLSYAAIQPRISKRELANFVFDRITDYEGCVIDHDGYQIDLLRMDVDAILGGDSDPSWSWCGDFLRARVRMPQQNAAAKMAVRYKLLWIALAIFNPRAARNVLN
jgi:hypothetical protein